MDAGFHGEALDRVPISEPVPSTEVRLSDLVEAPVPPTAQEASLNATPAELDVNARPLDLGQDSRPIESSSLDAAPESEAMQQEEHNESVSTQEGSSKEARSVPKRAPRPSLPAQKGTTVFPVARISKIIKADSAVDICSKEATFLISAATVRGTVLIQELFVKRFVEDACVNARMDKRKMVRYDDMAKATLQNEYFDFLRDVVPMPVPLSVAMQQRNELGKDQEQDQDQDAGQNKQDASPETDQPAATAASPTPVESMPNPSTASSLTGNIGTLDINPAADEAPQLTRTEENHTPHHSIDSDHQESVAMDLGN
ncbi:hypothetical protein MYAM1_003583 [Malassezia yamatoensis]|uniref:Transcription factor CBF/NF-Y/archaeal histone domain-containing protein n=1 Tax=Malassezia yamatoensis TaxID=253288 RepID=A0AAJ6CIC4_9BASI|nr:hypothetical protein MYAM1_003583 [Malassezia yamatoensis]